MYKFSVQSRGGHGVIQMAPFFIKWPLGKARVGHLLHNMNGEILGHVLFSSELLKSIENDPLKNSLIEHCKF